AVAPLAAQRLATLDYASVALVTLAFRARDVRLPTGSGFLVPPVERRLVKAMTASSAKWAWYGEAAPDLVLLRLSVGRHREERDLQRDDAELTTAVRHDLADLTGIAAEPVDTLVTRWGGSLPQYAVGHLDLVASVRADVARLPGLAVCGAAYDGVGVPACIASGQRAAADVLGSLAVRPTEDNG
ncbi:MAG: FAD-dependent oxidoreductase, partial [Actinomycetota bacterium]|nr:FAD-dependent oxidoreductase [Actinomycetota bacterium]